MKSIFLIFTFLLFVTGVLMAQMPDPSKYYKINPSHSPHFISINSNHFKNGTTLIQWETPSGTCEDGQAWKFEKVGDYYKITARNKYGKCMTVWENKQAGAVAIDDFKNTDNQIWKVSDLGGGKFSIISKLNNYSLNISGANPNNGGQVIVWPYTASANDQFKLVPAEEEYPYWENLGPEVNSSRSEFSPCFAPDGKTLYFSRGDAQGMYIYDSEVYMAELKPDNTWGNVKRVPEFEHNKRGQVLSFLPGGNEVILFGDFTGGNDLFSIMEKTKDGWSQPRPMGIKNPGIKFNSWNGVLAADGRTFVMEMNLTDRNNESDLYVSLKDDKGNWSKPKSFGDKINKPMTWEGTPYISPDMTTVYFNSNREGQQGTDIYMIKRLDDTWTNWTQPVKIDKGIYQWSIIQNYSVPGNGEYGYFVSGMKTFGEGDLFRMKTVPNVKPDPFLIINGKTLNAKTNAPVESDIYFENLETGKRVGEVISNPATGDYQIALPKGKNYGVYASSKGYYSISENVDLTNLTGFETIEKNLYLSPLTKGEAIRINNIFFDFGKATLKAESFPELDRVYNMLKENSALSIELRGHTDNVGDDTSNQTLSDNRAKAVKDYLIKKGIKESRLTSAGFGETKPVSDNATDKGRQENRRVEFVVL